MELTAATWNLMMPVDEPLRYNGQAKRAERVATGVQASLDTIQFLDCLAVQESMVPRHHERIRSDLHRLGFIYATPQLTGAKWSQIVLGGLVLFSRLPITHYESLVFEGKCSREDCLAAKGALYCRLDKHGVPFHVVAFHCQAWESPESRSVRRGQMRELADFVSRQNVPPHEPLVFLGDCNTDLYSERQQLDALWNLLDATWLPRHPLTFPFTSDPRSNPLMGIDDQTAYRSPTYPQGCFGVPGEPCVCCPQEWLDYAGYSRRHLTPDLNDSWMRAVPVKVAPFRVHLTLTKTAWLRDLSDHYPIVARFAFPQLQARIPVASLPALLPPPLKGEADVVGWLTWSVVGLLLVLAVGISMAVRKRSRTV